MKLAPADHLQHPTTELTERHRWKVDKWDLALYRHAPSGRWIGVVRKGAHASQFVNSEREQLIEEMEAETSPPPPAIKGYKGAIERFLYLYPGGFENAAYLAGERGGKLKAGDQLRPILDSHTTDEDAVPLLRSALALLNRGKQSPLHMTESSDLDRAWRGPGADLHIRALRAFGEGDRNNAFRLTRRALEGGRCSWPMATLFPGLLQPKQDAVLRPEAVKTFARSVRSSFIDIYESEPNFAVYEAFLHMLDVTAKEIAELAPRDYVDLVSFVWVTTSYPVKESPRRA